MKKRLRDQDMTQLSQSNPSPPLFLSSSWVAANDRNCYNVTMIEPDDTEVRLAAAELMEPEPGEASPTEPAVVELPRAGLGEKLLPFLITAVALGLDQLTKYLVETRIPLYSYWAPIPALENIFRITHTANTGAVFGLFQGTGMFFAGLAVVVAGAIIYFNLTLPGRQWLLRLALGLQLGGALGNLVDRLRIGHVTDFIDVGPWYIFNVADMAIVSGVILFAFVLLREAREESAQAKASQSSLSTADSQE